ncbi:hypothetical protein [Deinococcus navajonensis]|uniref:Glycosyl hydrolase family 4 C-terminal domain-containing protein n=1 Tax=Deinococcus navajonensis TaxID=309884 RepID=A0ABV8XNX8_9DEIO
MTRVVMVGAGGMTFGLALATDLLTEPMLQGAELVLYDPDLSRAERTARAAQAVAGARHQPLDLKVTDHRRSALRAADYVLLTFQIGGLEAYRTDLDIPRRFGVDCVAGDTLNPGGVMRFVRSSAVFEALAQDMQDLCPDALVLNYTNPMAMNTLYLAQLGLRVVGLCHSIPGTAAVIARLLGLAPQTLTYRAAGINHQAWFLTLEAAGVDQRHRLRAALREQFLPAYGGATPWTEGEGTYAGGQERVRAELMETFGHFTSESSHHASEYVPYFRRSPEAVKAHLPRRWDYLRTAQAMQGQEAGLIGASVRQLSHDPRPSGEGAMPLIAALEGGEQTELYVNVRNDGWITNLPAEACVEVPAQVDRRGIRPQQIGRLPAACAGLNLTGIALQTTAVEAVAARDPEGLLAAFALDPLTASLLDLGSIRAMAHELFQAQRSWLPGWLRPAVGQR